MAQESLTSEEILGHMVRDGEERPTWQDLVSWFHARWCPQDTLHECNRRMSSLLSPPWQPDDRTRDTIEIVGLASEGLLFLSVRGSNPEGLPNIETGQMSITALYSRYNRLLESVKQGDGVHEYRWKALKIPVEPLFPITPLVRAWQSRPKQVRPVNRMTGRVIPERLGMAREGERDGESRMFTPASHASPDGQTMLPGFGLEYEAPIALPLALWRMGNGAEVTPGLGLPLAQRLFLAALTEIPTLARNGESRYFDQPLRQFLKWIYPNGFPKGKAFWNRLDRAVEAVDRARIPIFDPSIGRTAERHIVTFTDFPEQTRDLDSNVRITVHLPGGCEYGPAIPNSFNSWAVKSANPARLLLNLAYHWHNPGMTLRPIGKRADGKGMFWTRSNDPQDYPALSDDDLAAMTLPLSTIRDPNVRRTKARKALKKLEQAQEIRIIEGKVMPPKRD